MRRRGGLREGALVALAYAGFLAATACAANPRPSAVPPALAFHLVWHAPADLDLHVQSPLGEEVWFTEPKSASGGVLDTDCNVDPRTPCPHPSETVTWPPSQAPAGNYLYWVRLMHPRESRLPVAFTVIVLRGGKRIAEQHGQLGEPGEASHKWGLVYGDSH